jgi:divalent metal cation (Fe/Co/Zn/Cd) transporter
MMLFTLGGAFSVWEAIRKLLHGAEHVSSAWSYAILGGAFVFEGASLTVAVRSLRGVLAGRSLREYWRQTRDPTLLTVLFEDSAALVSLVVAAGGLALAQATGWMLWDAVASAVIGVILLAVATALAFENHSLLIGERAQDDVEQMMREALSKDEAVVSIESLRTMHVGPHRIIAMIGVRLREDLGPDEVVESLRRLHTRIESVFHRDVRPRFVAIEPVGLGRERRIA